METVMGDKHSRKGNQQWNNNKINHSNNKEDGINRDGKTLTTPIKTCKDCGIHSNMERGHSQRRRPMKNGKW